MNMDRAIKDYLLDPLNGLNTLASLISYRKTLMTAGRSVHWKDVTHVTEADLVDFVTNGSVSSATTYARRTRVMGLFAWLYAKGHINANPAENLTRIIKLNVKPVRTNYWLTYDEALEVIDAAKQVGDLRGLRDELILRLGFTCGLRRDEICGLTWGQVNLDRQEIYLVGKGGKHASVYINDRTCQALRNMYDLNGERVDTDPVIIGLGYMAGTNTVHWHEGISGRTVGDIVARISKQTGIMFRPHDMRRSFAGMLEEKGANVYQISDALRHSNAATTQRYLEARQDKAYQAVKGLGLSL